MSWTSSISTFHLYYQVLLTLIINIHPLQFIFPHLLSSEKTEILSLTSKAQSQYEIRAVNTPDLDISRTESLPNNKLAKDNTKNILICQHPVEEMLARLQDLPRKMQKVSKEIEQLREGIKNPERREKSLNRNDTPTKEQPLVLSISSRASVSSCFKSMVTVEMVKEHRIR
ncbi:hypothetical protein E4T56_gene19322 [Termitomyces sp. T112]|nr:hypothetical protein E4T56_gene19322 [Termitomyces sp. T112]